jgi:hypothetical protein
VRHGEPALLAGLLLSFAAVIAVLTFRLSPVARLVPVFVLVPTLALLALGFVLELRRARPGSLPSRGRGAAPIEASSEHKVLAWILSLPILVVLIGLAPAVLAFTFLCLRGWARLSLLRSSAIAAVMAAAVYGMSSIAVSQRALEGWIWTALGGIL